VGLFNNRSDCRGHCHVGAEIGGRFHKACPFSDVILGYGVAFYFLSLTLKNIPVGIAYAVWSGLGITLISIIGYFFYHQTLDVPAIIGLVLILLGVVVINVFSETVSH